MQLLDKTLFPYIREKEITARVNELAQQISRDYAGKDPIFIILLNGAFLFASDLVKEISIPCQLSFIKVSSYSGTQSLGELRELIGLSENIKDRHVILLDDIIDTGLTMDNVLTQIRNQHPASVSTVSLLLKPDMFANAFKPDYIGFSIPNTFVVGYGLDYNGYGRNLKDIWQITG